MKNLLIVAILLGSFGLNAQPNTGHHQKRDKHPKELLKDLTPEQRAEIFSKKMVLHLDLTDKQQEQVAALLLEREANRPDDRPSKKEIKELAAEQRFQLMNEKLDNKIEFNRQLKTILTEAQWTKWNEVQDHKKNRRMAMKTRMKR